jgi:hypothetical protein
MIFNEFNENTEVVLQSIALHKRLIIRKIGTLSYKNEKSTETGMKKNTLTG